MEKEDRALVLKRTKSYCLIPCDYKFTTIRELADRLIENAQD